MSKGNFLDIILSTGFVVACAYALYALSGINPTRVVSALWLIFLVIDVIVAVASNQAMKGKKKYKLTKGDIWRFAILLLLALLVISLLFGGINLLFSFQYSADEVQRQLLLDITMFTFTILLVSTLARAGVKLNTAFLHRLHQK
ncbi:hypothetical protein OfM1_05140 [Lactovum odontotermitis]